ncbi:hypothetical protein os1_01170 [Comamonadaceae bacterium OS-1]|nr:hypothetical protein os1_01170 [Comamonadaceae bacterium OS-1]
MVHTYTEPHPEFLCTTYSTPAFNLQKPIRLRKDIIQRNRPFKSISLMTNGEKSTLAISACALIVAAFTLYLTEFRREDRLEAVVLEADPLGGEMMYQVALLNNGNKPALVQSAMLLMRSNANELVADNPLSEIEVRPSLPVVIEKGGILVLTFSGHMKSENMHLRGNLPTQQSKISEFDGEATRKIMIDAHFQPIDSTGQIYHAITDPLIAHITSKKVAISDHQGSQRSIFRSE